MAERQSITPSRGDVRLTRQNPLGWETPFQALQRFTDEIDRMFSDFGFGRRALTSRELSRETTSGAIWAPEVEVIQKANELIVRADLPGLKKDEVSVEVTDNAIVVQGERRREREEEHEGLYRSERSYGSFSRVIPLPEGAIVDQAKATFRDGVLEITMPAPPAHPGRRLEITEGSGKK